MANEITVMCKLQSTIGYQDISRQINGYKVNQTNLGGCMMIVDVGTGGTALSLGDVDTPGYAYFRNLDSTATITIKPTTGTDFLKLLPGDPAILRLATGSLTATSSVGTAKLEYLVLEA